MENMQREISDQFSTLVYSTSNESMIELSLKLLKPQSALYTDKDGILDVKLRSAVFN
jgi:hypothetical protein